jgi:cysteinyl-tRNA synthetase
MVTGNQSVLKKTLAAGFDGVWLDWVQAYRHPSVIASAQKAGVDPAREMINLLAKVREQSRAVKPAALVVALNCPFLVDSNRALLESIDALAIEGIWFSGKGDVAWDSAEGGDIPNSATDETSTPARLAKCAEFVASGKPVFTVDYCLKKSNAQKVYAESKAKGFVPLVTQSSMAKMTSTPPSR